MDTVQVENSIPEYKLELRAQLKERLGSQVANQVASKCGFSDRYVRAWFSNSRINESIRTAAMNLLEELKATEEQIQQDLVK